MAKTKSRTKQADIDGLYLLKLVLYVLAGSLWIRVSTSSIEIALPIGFMLALIIATHEKFRIDRKIEYAVLVLAMLVGYFAPYGLYISL